MSRKKKLALYLGLIIIISAYLFTYFELFFTWESAYRHWERNVHFGPATEREVIEHDSGHLIFAAHGDWFRPFYVRRVFGILHSPEDVLGRTLNPLEEMESEGEESVVLRKRRFYMEKEIITAFYAFADESVAAIEIQLKNGEILAMKSFSRGIFYKDYLSDMWNLTDYVEEIRGYDDQGQLVSRVE